MTVEMNREEAELLIAILTGAEGAFAVVQPELVRAMEDLRLFRSALLQAYLRDQVTPDPQEIEALLTERGR